MWRSRRRVNEHGGATRSSKKGERLWNLCAARARTACGSSAVPRGVQSCAEISVRLVSAGARGLGSEKPLWGFARSKPAWTNIRHAHRSFCDRDATPMHQAIVGVPPASVPRFMTVSELGWAAATRRRSPPGMPGGRGVVFVRWGAVPSRVLFRAISDATPSAMRRRARRTCAAAGLRRQAEPARVSSVRTALHLRSRRWRTVYGHRPRSGTEAAGVTGSGSTGACLAAYGRIADAGPRRAAREQTSKAGFAECEAPRAGALRATARQIAK